MHPYVSQKHLSVGSLGEIALLRRIRDNLGSSAPPSPHGMGDDTAVLLSGKESPNLITADSLVYGRHFDDSVSAEDAGAKLLKRNLSDIAAMGGKPHSAVMSAFLPKETGLDWMDRFVRGMAECARTYDVPLVGGDLTDVDGLLGFSLTLLGFSARPILRTGAAIGDQLWVTGTLGGSILGHHLNFRPRLEEGRWLGARENEVASMIDVTDGIAKDALSLVGEGMSVELDLSALPVSSAARELARRDGRTELDHVLCDGEDYELLFVVRETVSSEQFRAEWAAVFETPVCQIGVIGEMGSDGGPLVEWGSKRPILSGGGYEHFR